MEVIRSFLEKERGGEGGRELTSVGVVGRFKLFQSGSAVENLVCPNS